MDAPEWKNSMCNELGCLYQGWKAQAGTDKIEFISHKYKPKDIGVTYVRAVCNIRLQKTETHRTRLTEGWNMIDYPGDIRTPTSDLTTMKIHVNISISDVKPISMRMDVKYFYLNNHVDRYEYTMIQI